MIVFAKPDNGRADPRAISRVVAVCHTCARQHKIEFDPRTGPGNAFADWYLKHPGPDHLVEFRAPSRNQRADQLSVEDAGFLHYLHNADAKVAYAASAAYTCGVASLASSSTFLAGREGTAVDNSTNKYLDYILAGHVCVGTTPTTAKSIRVYCYGTQNDTPLYPANVTGSDAALTVTNAEMLQSGLQLAASIPIVATTSDIKYPWSPRSLCAIFGLMFPPTHHGLFISHDTVAALNGTAGNHIQSYKPVYATVA